MFQILAKWLMLAQIRARNINDFFNIILLQIRVKASNPDQILRQNVDACLKHPRNKTRFVAGAKAGYITRTYDKHSASQYEEDIFRQKFTRTSTPERTISL